MKKDEEFNFEFFGLLKMKCVNPTRRSIIIIIILSILIPVLLYILIEKYTTFSLKSIPLLVFNELLIKTTSNAKTYDKNGYEARNLEKVLSRM